MGMHVVGGTPSKSPGFFYSSGENLSWCELELADMSMEQAFAMRRFVQMSAYEHGRKDAGRPDWNPFHPQYLLGEPHALWESLYRLGKSDKEAGIDREEVTFWDWDDYPDRRGEPCVDVMLELAEKAEAAYREIGVTAESILMMHARGLIGWFGLHID